MTDILLYTECKSPKLQYVLEFISNQFDAIKFILNDASNPPLENQFNIKVNYSNSVQNNAINISCSGYFKNFDLNEDPSLERDLTFENGKSNFDFLAAIFFLLSRVEEYRDNPRDQHGRFQSSSSLTSKLDLLKYPIIDEWIQAFEKKILETFGIKLQKRNGYSFTSTIDIDHIFAYRSKPYFVKVGAFVRDLFTLKFQRMKDRFLESDPYDTFDYLVEVNKNKGSNNKAFILTSERGKFDKSLHPSHKEFISKVKSLSENFNIGIHPSYQSELDLEKLEKEKSDLGKIVNADIVDSRQHYLKMNLPDTYRNLIKAGITNDFTMGYPDKVGFRAGTSQSFAWYDLESDHSTELTIHPFAIMDVTLKQYLKLNKEAAISLSKRIIDSIRKVDGQFILIWHNSSFYHSEGWKDWKEIYEEILSYAKID